MPAIDMVEARKKCQKTRLEKYVSPSPVLPFHLTDSEPQAEQVQLNSMSSGLLIQEYEVSTLFLLERIRSSKG